MNKIRIHYGEEQWEQWILECRDSGMAIKDWCAQHDLDRHQFYKWRKKLLSDGTIDDYPRRSKRTHSHSEPEAEGHLPAVVQVDLAESGTGSGDGPGMPDFGGEEKGWLPFPDSQVMIETPLQGYRIHLGSGFSQDVLRRLREVVQ